MFNGNLKLIISYPYEEDLEFNLDNNTSFEEIKKHIAEKFNVSESDTFNIKLFDIKYEKIDSNNSQIKIQLKAKENKEVLISKIKSLNQSIKEKDLKIEELNKEINLYKNQINKIKNNYDEIHNLLMSETETKIQALKSDLNNLVEEDLTKKKENLNNNDIFQENDVFKQIEDEINEIKKNNKSDDMINMDEKLKEFKNIYKTENTGFSDDDLKKILLECNYDFFTAGFILIKKSSETK